MISIILIFNYLKRYDKSKSIDKTFMKRLRKNALHVDIDFAKEHLHISNNGLNFWVPLSDTDFRFSFNKLCFSCSFLLILNNENISKKFWAMAAYQNLNSLISVFLITLITPLKKNNLGAKVSVTQDWHLHPPLAVPGRRERKFITQYGCQ